MNEKSRKAFFAKHKPMSQTQINAHLTEVLGSKFNYKKKGSTPQANWANAREIIHRKGWAGLATSDQFYKWTGKKPSTKKVQYSRTSGKPI